MDRFDLRILDLLQRDCTVPVADIGHRIGLSTTPCWRRIRNLESDGVIRARVALLDRQHIGVGVTVFVRVRTDRHDAEWLDRFAEAVRGFDEVVEFYRMSGEIDYLLKVVVPDIAAYDTFYKRLIAAVPLADVSSNFAMEEIKYTTVLPLDHAG